ncbi:MAG: sugar phosphate isomerase/epimerase family protein [Halobacteriaceae archaeon]
MEYALNEVCFPYDDLERNCELAREAGYDGIEPKMTRERVADPSLLGAVKDAANERGLAVPSAAGGPLLGWKHLATPDDEARAEGVERAVGAIEGIGRHLDLECLLVVPGEVTADIPYDAAHENTLDSVRELAAAADAAGFTLGLENVRSDFLYSPLEFRDFVDEAADAGPVAAYFDAGNARAVGHPEQWVPILGDRIDRVHVKGHVRARCEHTYPLQGDVDWAATTAALDELGFDGWVAPEVSPYESQPDQTPGQVLANMRAIFE